MLRATGRLGVDLPSQVGPDAPEKAGRLSRPHRAPIARAASVLVLDHLEEALDDRGRAAEVVALLARVVEAGGARLRLVLGVDERGLRAARAARDARAGAGLTPSAWMSLARLSGEQAPEILERTALQSGTFFETGLSAAVAPISAAAALPAAGSAALRAR